MAQFTVQVGFALYAGMQFAQFSMADSSTCFCQRRKSFLQHSFVTV